MSDERGRGQAGGRMSGWRRKRRDRQVGVGWGGEGEREERHGSQSAHTVKAGRSVRCPQRDTRTVARVVVYLERGGGGTFKWLFVLISLPLLTPSHSSPRPLHPSTQSTYLQNKKSRTAM